MGAVSPEPASMQATVSWKARRAPSMAVSFHAPAPSETQRAITRLEFMFLSSYQLMASTSTCRIGI